MTNDVLKAEEDMKKSYLGQKNENNKMQQQITTLKTEKTNLQQQLLDLQRRTAELELQIGADTEANHWLINIHNNSLILLMYALTIALLLSPLDAHKIT